MCEVERVAMAALFGFPLETALFSLPSTIVPRSGSSSSSAKHSSFPPQKLSDHGFAFTHSAFVSSGSLQVQAKLSNSEDPIGDDDKTGMNLYGADSIPPSGSPWASNIMSENENTQKSTRISNAFQRAAAYKKAKSSSKPAEEPSMPPEDQAVKENSQVRQPFSASGRFHDSKESQSVPFSATESSNLPVSGDALIGFRNPDNSSNQDGSKSDESAQNSSNTSQNAALLDFKEAEAHKQQTEEMVSALSKGLDHVKEKAVEEKTIEIEIITRDGVIKRRASKPGKNNFNAKEFKKQGMDFVGLDFSQRKKKPGLPAGLSAGIMAPPSKGIPEVEIITRDADQSAKQLDSSEELYKPKVSTWGVFPRPANISKTYGGGRIIKPGEQLETADEKKAREAKTQQLLSEYRKKLGLDLDPIIKANCEKIMKQGNGLMDGGKLIEAWSCFEDIMGQVTFKSDLHGLAALQGAVCLDSLNRSGEAKLMYEKLVSHPNQAVKKRAQQLLFSFRAMDKMKFSGSYDLDASAYRKYFDAFSAGYNSYNTMYRAPKSDRNDNPESEQIWSYAQIWPYALFFSFPLVLVFILVVLKG